MSNVIPPLLSSSPPPIIANDDEDDDEFGDFTSAVDLSFNCGSLSIPVTPQPSPTKTTAPPISKEEIDINSNTNQIIKDDLIENSFEKDFQDKRKEVLPDANSTPPSESDVNLPNTGCINVNNATTDDVHKNSADCDREVAADEKSNADLLANEKGAPSSTRPQNYANDKVTLEDDGDFDEFNDFQTSQNKDCQNEDATAPSYNNSTAVPGDVPKETVEINGRVQGDALPGDVASKNELNDPNVAKTPQAAIILNSTHRTDAGENVSIKTNEALVSKLNQETVFPSALGAPDDFDDFQSSALSDEGALKNSKAPAQSPCREIKSATFDRVNTETSLNDRFSDDDKLEVPGGAVMRSHSGSTIVANGVNDDFSPEFDDFQCVSSDAANPEPVIKAPDNPYLEEPPDLPPDQEETEEETDEFGDFENQPLELDSESESQHTPGESLVPYEENKDDFNYVGILRSVRESTILTNSTPDAIAIDGSELGKLGDGLLADFKQKDGTLEDEFGDFDNFQSVVPSDTPTPNNLQVDVNWETTNDDDDFGDFTDFKDAAVHQPPVEEKDQAEPTASGDFANFSSASIPQVVGEQTQSTEDDPSGASKGDDGDDFGAFNDFGTVSLPKEAMPMEGEGKQEGDDEFGDFSSETQDVGDFDDAPGAQTVASFISNIEDVPKQAEKIILEMFPDALEKVDEFKGFDFIIDDFVFGEVKDVTDTNALTYQWPKSASQETLLKSLNIDMRNILHGPGWCTSMPRYASNLGLTPLEPMKPEVLTPVPAQGATSTPPRSIQVQAASTSSNQGDIPSAQFDWTSSGLTNPLDYSQATMMLLDLEQLVASMDIPPTTTPNPGSRNSPSPTKDCDAWDNWLRTQAKDALEKSNQSASAHMKNDDLSMGELTAAVSQLRAQGDTESVNSLQFTETPPEVEEAVNEASSSQKADSNDDFDDFAPFKSNKPEEWPNDNMIPLRETHISSNPKRKADSEPGWLKPTILTPDLPRRDNISLDDDFDDDFTDFQMSLPSKTPPIASFTDFEGNLTQADAIQPPENPIGEIAVKNYVECPKEMDAFKTVSKAEGKDDDDFGSFQSVIKETSFRSFQPLQPTPVLEPLKPTVVASTNLTSNAPAQINWPDPGIIEEDILSAFSYRNPALQGATLKNNEGSPDASKTVEASGLPKPPEGSIFQKAAPESSLFQKPSNSPTLQKNADAPIFQKENPSLQSAPEILALKKAPESPIFQRVSLRKPPAPESQVGTPRSGDLPFPSGQASVSNNSATNLPAYGANSSTNNLPFYDLPLPATNFSTSSSSLFNSLTTTNIPSQGLALQSTSKKGNKTDNKASLQQDDDDDWTDFVSSQDVLAPAQNAQPPRPLTATYNQLRAPERTSPPELQLSIGHLSQIQPPKQPIPVITPHGLMQTKLPANTSLPIKVESLQTPLSQINQWQVKPNDGYRPAIISNQYNAQFAPTNNHLPQTTPFNLNQFPNNGYVPQSSNFWSQSGTNGMLPSSLYHHPRSSQQATHFSSKASSNFSTSSKNEPPKVSTQAAQDDDDDWTDFVSSQPVPQAQSNTYNNGFYPLQQERTTWNRGPQFPNWTSTSVSPNIITNPGHFDSFKGSAPPLSSDTLKNKTSVKRTVNVTSRKSTVPSISALPDLEFVAPKGRTVKK